MTLRRLPACFVLAAALLAGGCQSSSESVGPMQGTWVVDIDATLAGAKADGMPERYAPKIRETYQGARLEITDDALLLGLVGGSGETMHMDYKVTGRKGDCYSVEVSGAPATSEMCFAGDVLRMRDGEKLTVVYKRA